MGRILGTLGRSAKDESTSLETSWSEALDGTSNYINQDEPWAVSVALVDDWQVVAGVFVFWLCAFFDPSMFKHKRREQSSEE